VLMTIGKTAMRKITTIFGPIPKPIQRTSTGAMATFGTACSASRIG